MRPIRPSSSIWKPAVCSAVSELTRAKKGSFPDRRSPFFSIGCLDSKNRCGSSLGCRSGCRTLYLVFQGGKVMYDNQSNCREFYHLWKRFLSIKGGQAKYVQTSSTHHMAEPSRGTVAGTAYSVRCDHARHTAMRLLSLHFLPSGSMAVLYIQ